MKREIKFRCFDKQYKTMHNVNMILFSTNELDHDGNNGEPKSIDHFELMQFTGLTDKNGKGIYDGDIVIQEKWVSVGNYVPSHGVVKYKGIGFTCECFGDWKGSDADLNGNAVVIGNIYENPELLQP